MFSTTEQTLGKMIKFLFLVITLACICYAANPGVQVAINKSGLNYAAKKAVDIMSEKIPNMKFPDVSGKKVLRYEIYDIKLTSFTKPSASVTTSPNTGLTINLNGGAATVSGRWGIKMLFGWRRGDISASSGNMNLQLKVDITEKNGRPKLVAKGCSANFQKFNIKIKGGILGWLLNIIAILFNNKIRKNVENLVCSKLQQVVNVDANNELSTLNLIAPINKHIKLDYHLTGAPQFYNTHMTSSHKGKFLVDPQSVFNPSQMAFTMGKMVSTSISQDTFNSLGRVLHSKNLLKYDFSFDNNFLGNVFKGPSKIDTSISSISPPTVDIQSSKMEVEGSFNVEFSSNRLLLKLKVTAKAKAYLKIQGKRLKGRLSNLQLNVDLLQNNLGVLLSSSLINSYAQKVLPFILLPINQKLNQGLPLPKTQHVSFSAYTLKLASKQVRLAFNVS